MSAIGRKLRRVEGGRIAFWCPGCNSSHQIIVDGTRGWSWNGSGDYPTISPSILVNAPGQFHNPSALTCHSFVTGGRIQFLGDCTHVLAGQMVELPDWPS